MTVYISQRNVIYALLYMQVKSLQQELANEQSQNQVSDNIVTLSSYIVT